MGFLARDTDRSAEHAQIEILRSMPAWRKLELVADCCESNRTLLEAGLRSRFPNADDAEIQRMLLDLVLGQQTAARIKTAEDTVLRKLQWFRSGGEVSDRQWKDVLGVVATVGAGLDRSYLRTWATELGIVDLLDRAIAEVDGG